MPSPRSARRCSGGNDMSENSSPVPCSSPARRSPLHDLAPASIAIVGASADPTKRGYKAMVGLVKRRLLRPHLPDQPKGAEILGVPTCATLDDVPGRSTWR